MGESLGDILGKKNISEPPEIAMIKKFVQDEIGETPQVKVTERSFIVSVQGASAVATLRFKIFQLQRKLGDKRKIILKII